MSPARDRRGRLGAALLALLALLPAARAGASAADATAAIARGDAAWERRGEGHVGGRAAAGPIGEAVAAYDEAAQSDPQSLEARWKLMRALYFQGEYVAASDDEKKAVFGRGREVGEAALDLLAQPLGGRAKLDRMKPPEIATALAQRPEALPIYFWSAVNWGLWGEAFGKFAAARQGVAGKIRDDCAVVLRLDERYERAGGHRVLGRLHARAPSIPFFTGWIDRDTAIAELRKARELAPEEPLNTLYLAEALLEYRPQSRAEAQALLRELVSQPGEPDRPVEWAKAQEQARALLAGDAR